MIFVDKQQVQEPQLHSFIMKVAVVATIFSWLISTTAGQQELELFSCSSEGVQCDHHGGSGLLDTVLHVVGVEECRQLCLQDED